MKTVRLIFLALVLSFGFVTMGCQQNGDTEEQGKPEESLETEQEEKEEVNIEEEQAESIEDELEKEKKEEVTITIGAIGDVLLHERVYELAETDHENYDFLPMLNTIEPLLQAPDFVMANQESMPGGVEIGLSTYPAFNSPQEIVSDLQSLGVDMVIGANNHTLDRGIEAIESALDFYDEIEMEYVGVYRDTEDRETDRIVTIDDVSLGVLAYTYGTNGIPIPEGHDDVVALIEPERIVEDVHRLRDQVDVVIVHLHWGDEYEREPNEEQRDLALTLAQAGADIIFGHHPHVLQPMEWIQAEEDQETLVFYSLGNFLSGQDFEYTDIGGVATVEVTKVTEGDETDVQLHSPNIEPTQVIRKENGYFVVPMAEAESPPVSGTTRSETVEHTGRYLTE